MKLIVGLGNPGRRYEGTRHNVGARVVAELAGALRVREAEERFTGRFARARLGEEAVGLLAPGTWMNASGDAVVQALDAFPEVEASRDLLVVFDDADLPLGRLRLRARGSSGGHRGLGDVLDCLGHEDVPRLRFGIGRPSEPVGTRDFVLERFSAEEEPLVAAATARAGEAVGCFVREGIVAAMNGFNPDPA